MLILDTDNIPLLDRKAALADALSSAALATYMTPTGRPEEVRMRMHIWDLGGLEVVDTECSAHVVRRTKGSDEEPVFAFTSAKIGDGVHRQDEHELLVRPATIFATDLGAPYDHRVSGTRTISLKVPLSLLGIAPDLVGPALTHIGQSPLAPLFDRHIAEVRRVADDLNATAARSLGTATLALARAVFASISPNERLGRETLEDILITRVKAFVAQHLSDPRLTAETVAAATNVSVRHLYQACAREDLKLEQWIIEQRLRHAREDLAAVPDVVGVAEVARRWGFANPSHFARRFRQAYGMSPREWQAANSVRVRGEMRPLNVPPPATPAGTFRTRP